MSTPNGPFGFGSPASPEQIAGWDIDIGRMAPAYPRAAARSSRGKSSSLA